MKLVPTDIPPIEKCEQHKRHNIYPIIRDFVYGNDSAVEIKLKNDDYASPLNCYKSFWRAIRNYDFERDVKVVKRGDRIFLEQKLRRNLL